VGIHLHINYVVRELKFGKPEPEVLCCVHELQETWDGNRELIEEPNFKLLEARGGDPMNKCFQESSNTSELENMKVREGYSCHGWRMRVLPLHIMVGNNKVKGDQECLQLGHE
jgi:hypothetical protein